MSDQPVQGASPWPISLWLLFSMAAFSTAVAIAAELLSSTLILDLAALWPAVALGIVFVPIAFLRAGLWRWIPPAIMLAWLLTGLALHLNGLEFLPSAVGDIDVEILSNEVGSAQLIAGPVDSLSVEFGEEPQLVSVTMRRRGGDVAPAVATPLVGDGRAEVVLSEREDAGFFEFERWDLRLGSAPSWELDLAASQLLIDTGGLVTGSIVASGSGVIALSGTSADSIVEVNGVFEITVPRGVGVVVDGQAETPNDWTRTERGLTAPGETRWTVIVVGDSRVSVSYEDP